MASSNSGIPLTMRAIALDKFSNPSDYGLATLPVPQITQPDDLLIKVHAASVNPVDMKMASPKIGPLMDPTATFPYKLSYDVSGVIVATGSNPGNFKVGDEVYSRVPSTYRGTLAEFATSPVSHVALKPKSLSHAEAAAIPLAAQTALQVLREADSLLEGGLAGKTVLIPAGLSGTGSFGVQIAKKYFKAGKVITTLSPGKIDIVGGILGEGVLDQIVDYTQGQSAVLQQVGEKSVDFLFDTTGQSTALVSTVKPGGLILSISTLPSGEKIKKHQPDVKWWLKYVMDVTDWALTRYIAWWGVRYSYIFLAPSGKDLEVLTGIVERGEMKPVIGEVVGLEDLEGVRRGCGRLLEGKGGVGKFVVEVVKG